MPYKDIEVRKQKARERSYRWAKLHPDKANENARAWRLRNPKHMLHLMAKRRATRLGLEFSLSLNDIPEIPEICPVAQIPIHPRNDGKRGPCDNSPTLDRVDPTKGYVKNNIRVISHRGNRWKSEMTVDDIRQLLQYVETETEEAFRAQA